MEGKNDNSKILLFFKNTLNKWQKIQEKNMLTRIDILILYVYFFFQTGFNF